MAGIYIHVPFCKQACHYCDFHFSTQLNAKSEMVKAIVCEIRLQKNYLESENVETIYFGGGTPSMLSMAELDSILNVIYQYFSVDVDAEITLEANPDDISKSKLTDYKALKINRLSIGIQTFNNDVLRWMNRAHNAEEAIKALELCFDAGFENLSADLIYGIPSENHAAWQYDLKTILKYHIPHISAYNLTIEPQTAFGKWQKTGKLKEASNEFGTVQMEMLMESLSNAGFIHYEISNFAKEGHFSKHNTAYWLDKKYLGIGPSAHSYNGTSRQANVANNLKYVQSIQQNSVPFELELLSQSEKANELMLTGLRAIWGVSLVQLFALHSLNFDSFNRTVESYTNKGLTVIQNDRLKLTKEGRYFADKIAADLFFV